MPLTLPEIEWMRVTCKICGSDRTVPAPASIKVIMRALDVNQTEFAERLGVTSNSVWRWINSGIHPEEASVALMCGMVEIERPE
jgi:DNA-binding transcriptional regulator YiaG